MKLKEMLENLKNNDDMFIYDKVSVLFEIADKYSVYDTVDQIIKEDVIDDIIRDYLSTGSTWERIAIFLSGVKVLNQDYYHLNGYGNLENLSGRQFYIILDDFIEEIKYKGLENEEI